MNDHFLSFYILPVNPDSEWFYLYEAHDAQSLKEAIGRRSIKERAYLTVYTNTKEWLTVGSKVGAYIRTTYLDHHIISDTHAQKVWNTAKSIFDDQVNFDTDLRKLTEAHFPKVKRHMPHYLELIT